MPTTTPATRPPGVPLGRLVGNADAALVFVVGLGLFGILDIDGAVVETHSFDTQALMFVITGTIALAKEDAAVTVPEVD